MKVSSGTRWRIAHWLDRLKGFCWCDLVDYVLGHRVEMDRSERQFLLWSNKDEDGWITRGPLLGPPWRREHNGSLKCQAAAAKEGSCYCGKFATHEVQEATTMNAKFVVVGSTPRARLEETDGTLSA